MANNASEIRKIDELGRIVLPKSIRESLGLNVGDSLAVLQEDRKIVLEVYKSTCIFCGSEDSITDYKGKAICAKCRKELSK